jgi:hypothetical protein
VSRPNSRSWPRSNRSPPIAGYARLDGSAPSAPLGRRPHENMAVFASSWLHLLKNWSLRETRRRSYAVLLFDCVE